MKVQKIIEVKKMSRKIIGYMSDTTIRYIISDKELNIMSLHPKSLDNDTSQMGEYGGLVIQKANEAMNNDDLLSESAFISDARMNEIQEMVKSL